MTGKDDQVKAHMHFRDNVILIQHGSVNSQSKKNLLVSSIGLFLFSHSDWFISIPAALLRNWSVFGAN